MMRVTDASSLVRLRSLSAGVVLHLPLRIVFEDADTTSAGQDDHMGHVSITIPRAFARHARLRIRQ